jgi:hypothetical protein
VLIVSVGRYSGLGNRVRATLSGHSLAEFANRRFYYCWPTGRRFQAAMTDLWQYHEPTVPRFITKALSVRYPQRDADLAWIAAAERDRVWQVRTGQPLALPAGATTWTDRFRDLRPTAEIADRVNDFFDSNLRGRPYVGVMVRAHQHSHQQTRALSPMSWFVDRMRQIRRAVPDIGFYVSCDVPAVQDEIVSEFQNSFALAGKGGYNSNASIKASVVDLYLLASSVHILGPHYSSFPELAAYLADDRVALETSVNSAEFPAVQSWSLVSDPTRPSHRDG